MPVKMSKADPKNAERAAEHFAVKVLGCVKTVRAIQTQFQRQDLFASDVVGKKETGEHVYLQVTTGQYEAIRQRRKKLEKIPWHSTDTVAVLQLRKYSIGAKLTYAFHIYEYCFVPDLNTHVWREGANDQIVDKSWFKALKKL